MPVAPRCLHLTVFFAGLLVASCVSADGINLWPMPASVNSGSHTLCLGKAFALSTEGSGYSDASGILKDGFSRLLDAIKMEHTVDGGEAKGCRLLAGLRVLVLSADDTLNFGTDESYKLSVPVSAGQSYATIEAKTVYGALYGLQTFSQLCHFDLTRRTVEVLQAPWYISDQPRFSYRGLLIDTSRHYQPISMIKNVIDGMAYAKLNVLHWHIVDEQSFPLEIPSYPKLWNGAYSTAERYTMADALEIVHYAQRRGVNVLAEIDMPGHAQSWGNGYPSLWPDINCQKPLDVSKEFTFEVIDGILSDLSKVFKFKFVHLGGDEVNTSCWQSTPHVKKWLNKRGYTDSDAYEYFVLRAQKIALSHGYDIINWEEPFNDFGSKLSPKTIVQNWLGGGVAQKVTAAGLRCIVSNQDMWYLDHLDATWQQFYMNEPLNNIIDPKHQKLVIGGEVCMWGETVDVSDLEQTIWPRAAAAAERLWTPFSKLAEDPEKVADRLATFRCLLNRRGVAAAPLYAPGRGTPYGPGSCYEQ